MEKSENSHIIKPLVHTALAVSLGLILAKISCADRNDPPNEEIEEVTSSISDGTHEIVMRRPTSRVKKSTTHEIADSPEKTRLLLTADDLLEFPGKDIPEKGFGSVRIVNIDMRNSQELDNDPGLAAQYENAISRLVFDTEDGTTLHVYLPDEDFSVYFEIQYKLYEGDEDFVDIYSLAQFDDERGDFVGMSLGGAELSNATARKDIRKTVQESLIAFLKKNK